MQIVFLDVLGYVGWWCMTHKQFIHDSSECVYVRSLRDLLLTLHVEKVLYLGHAFVNLAMRRRGQISKLIAKGNLLR